MNLKNLNQKTTQAKKIIRQAFNRPPMKSSLATIITYCTNDYPFIHHTINQAAKFSQQIIIPYSDHFYNGSPENQTLITKTINQNPQAQFVPFKYDPRTTRSLWRGWQFLLRRLGLGQVWGPQYWICYARKLGFQQVKKDINYVLFLDADEVIDGHHFLAWLNSNQYLNYTALKLANYWYFRSPKYQATVWEDSPLLAKRTALNSAVFMDHDERNATFRSIKSKKARMVLGLDNQPMIHHYGWAKPKPNLIKKVQTWGHAKDRRWLKKIDTEFSRPFSGTDFIYHRSFITVKPFIKL